MVRLTLIILLVVLQAVFGIPPFLADGPYLWRALLYPFFHGSWWHLAVNAIAIWTIYRPGRCKPCRDLLFPFLISMAVYPLSFRPVVGFSNILYAAIAMRTPALSSPWWRQPAVIVFLIITVALLSVPRFSATTHIAAFLLGMGGAALGRWWQSIKSDAGRYL